MAKKKKKDTLPPLRKKKEINPPPNWRELINFSPYAADFKLEVNIDSIGYQADVSVLGEWAGTECRDLSDLPHAQKLELLNKYVSKAIRNWSKACSRIALKG